MSSDSAVADILQIGVVVSGAPRGAPVSGRGWKSTQTVRSSSMKRPGAQGASGKGSTSSSFRASKGQKLARDAARSLTAQIEAEKKSAKDAENERRAAKRARKAANASGGGVLQTINPAKLKRMTKKQLRSVKRTTVDKEGNTQLVPAYGR